MTAADRLELQIAVCQYEKAQRKLERDAETLGSRKALLQYLQCETWTEALQRARKNQPYSIFKIDGEVHVM